MAPLLCDSNGKSQIIQSGASRWPLYSLLMVSSAGMPTTPAMPAAGVPATAEAMRGRVPSTEPAGVAAAEGMSAAKARRMSSAAAKPVETAI